MRVLVVLVVAVLDTAVLGTASVACGLLDRSGRLPRRLAGAWAQVLLRALGVEVTVSGREQAPAGPAVYVANHGSSLDILVLLAHLDVDFRFVHKRSLYLVPLVGLHLYLGGHIGIERRRAFRARRGLDAAARRIRGGTSILAFPEGTRSPDGRLGRFKRGTFLLAIDAGVPVVPVSLCGVKAVVPRGLRSLRPGRVEVRLHPPLPTAGRRPEDAEAFAAEAREVVAAAVREVAA